MPQSVMFESWRGRYADSPRAISEHLESEQPHLRQYWVSQKATPVSKSAIPLRRHSPAYFARLASTDFLVSNDIVSKHLLKGPRVTYIQTWHGTPLKKIGFDEHLATYSGSTAHQKRMIRDVKKWDYLLSPSPICTDIFRSAFRFDGPVLETGYPRNDILHSSAKSIIRDRVRTDLGLDPAARVVLYAPTWRDNIRDPAGGFRDPGALDIATLRHLTEEGTILLSRMHNVVTPTNSSEPAHMDFYQDVSWYPDIAELYLAADLLVSDYSSAIYDFAVTGKPIILFAYDLDNYRDSVRGLYFDYEQWAPGAIVTSTEALAAAINDVDNGHAGMAQHYADFTAKFCPYEDGQATHRVVQQIFASQNLAAI